MYHFLPLIEKISQEGCRAALVPVADIRFDRAFRDACAANACGNYGRCWMCPPDVGDIDQLIEQAKQYRFAIVYQTVGAIEDSYDFEGMMEVAKKHNELAGRLQFLFDRQKFSAKLHLCAGGCHLCEECAKRSGEPCRHPQQALASLEAYGIDVSALARSAGLKYVNGENTVTYFGALLFSP